MSFVGCEQKIDSCVFKFNVTQLHDQKTPIGFVDVDLDEDVQCKLEKLSFMRKLTGFSNLVETQNLTVKHQVQQRLPAYFSVKLYPLVRGSGRLFTKLFDNLNVYCHQLLEVNLRYTLITATYN